MKVVEKEKADVIYKVCKTCSGCCAMVTESLSDGSSTKNIAVVYSRKEAEDMAKKYSVLTHREQDKETGKVNYWNENRNYFIEFQPDLHIK